MMGSSLPYKTTYLPYFTHYKTPLKNLYGSFTLASSIALPKVPYLRNVSLGLSLYHLYKPSTLQGLSPNVLVKSEIF